MAHKMRNAELIYDENGEEGGNLVGYVCPYCNKEIYYEELYEEDGFWIVCHYCRRAL